MAAKKKRNSKSTLSPWLAVVLALAIAAAAAVALLTDGSFSSNSPIPDLSDMPESSTDHDRNQIDQASRDQLRDILRSADNGNNTNHGE